MSAFMVFILVIALICLFGLIYFVIDSDTDDLTKAFVILFCIASTILFSILFHEVGLRKGASDVANGKYDVYYKADKQGEVVGAIVDFDSYKSEK